MNALNTVPVVINHLVFKVSLNGSFSCKKFSFERNFYLDFIDDFISFVNEQKSMSLYLDSEKDDEYNVKFVALNILLGGRSMLDRLDLDSGVR